MRQDFSNNILLLYDYLVRHSANGVVRVNVKEVAKYLNVSERSVHRYLQYLVNNGYITRLGKGVYRINPLPHPSLPHPIPFSSPTLSSPPSASLTASSQSYLINSSIISLLASAVSPQAIQQFISSIIREYRLHNVVISMKVSKNLNTLYKLPNKLANNNFIAQIYHNKQMLLIQFRDSWHFPTKHYTISDVLLFLMKLPYLVANDIESKLFLGIDYTSIELKYFELAIVFHDNVDTSIIESLANFYSVVANNELQVDYSHDNTELEFRGKSFKLLFELLSLMNPLLILEHIRQDYILDKQILEMLKQIKKELEELKKQQRSDKK